MAKKITISNLAQTKHVKFLMLLEKQSKASFELVLKKLFFAIGKTLRKDGLAKSDDQFKLDEGWTGEVAKIEVDLEGAIARVVDKHFKALQYMIMGDYAGKEAKAAAKELGLKVVPGMMQSAYLQSIDAHREHHKAVTGDEAPELPKPLLKASLDEIAKRSKRFTEKTTGDMKLEVLEAVDRVVKKTNQDNINRVHKEAHDLMSISGKDDALEEALNQSWDYVKMKDIKQELDGIEEKLVNKWDLATCTELANASATGTHQAMIEIYGGRDDSVRVVQMTLEDEKVCSFCNEVSKDKSGNYRYYKISDFKPSGWNYGKKKSEWELQIPPSHLRCRCDLVYVPAGFKVGQDGTLTKG